MCNECKECESESSKPRGRDGYSSQFSSPRNWSVSTNKVLTGTSPHLLKILYTLSTTSSKQIHRYIFR